MTLKPTHQTMLNRSSMCFFLWAIFPLPAGARRCLQRGSVGKRTDRSRQRTDNTPELAPTAFAHQTWKEQP